MSVKNIFINYNKEKENENEPKENIYNKFTPIMDITKEIETNKKNYVDEDILVSSTTKNIKKDILLFKDEILKDMKLFQSKINEKTKIDQKNITDKIEKFTIQIQKFNEKIIELSNLINTDKTIRDKVDTFIEFKKKTQEILMTNEIKIDNIDRDFHNNINRVDNILKDTVLYPGLIGGISKYKSFHDFMDYISTQLSQGVTFREKTHRDLNNFKVKIDNTTHNFSLKLDTLTNASNKYCDNSIKNLENKINSSLDLFNEKLGSARIENAAYAEEIKKTTEDLLKQISNIILIKNEIFNKFEDIVDFVKKDNSRVIKCFSGYKEQFYEMKKKFIDLSDFIRDVRFKKNIGEELNRRDFYTASKKISEFKKQKLNEENSDQNKEKKTFIKRGSVQNLINIKDIFKKEYKDNNLIINTPLSDIEEDKSIKKDQTIYSEFLKEYRRTESQIIESKKKFTEENDNKNDDNNLIENTLEKNKNSNNNIHHHHGHHHHHHHHNHQEHKHLHHNNKEKNLEKEKNENNTIYNKEGEFIQRRKKRLTTISETKNKFSIPFSKLFEFANNDKDNIKEEKNIINRNFKKLKTKKFDNYEIPKKLKNLDDININSSFKSSYSNSNKSRASSFSSCSLCKKSSRSSNSISDYKNKKLDKETQHLIIKEEDEKSRNNEERKKIKIKNINFSGEDKEMKNLKKSIKKENDIDSIIHPKNVKTKQINNQKEKNYESYISEEINKDNIPNLIITNYKDKKTIQSMFYRNNNSYQNNKQKSFSPFDSLKKISINLEGSNKLIINPNLKENNKIEKDIVKNVKNIINSHSTTKNSAFMPNKTYNGFPKIITNKGERVIIASHPVFHSKKFSNYINPNILALNYSIQSLYGKKFKKNIKQKNKNLKNIISNNMSDLNINKKFFIKSQANNKYETDINNKIIYGNNEGFNSERQKFSSLNEIFNENNILSGGLNLSLKNLK